MRRKVMWLLIVATVMVAAALGIDLVLSASSHHRP